MVENLNDGTGNAGEGAPHPQIASDVMNDLEQQMAERRRVAEEAAAAAERARLEALKPSAEVAAAAAALAGEQVEKPKETVFVQKKFDKVRKQLPAIIIIIVAVIIAIAVIIFATQN